MCVPPFLVSNLSTWLTWHHAFSSPLPRDVLNPLSLSPPPYPRQHVFVAVACIAVSTSGHSFSSSSKHHLRSIIIYPQQTTGPSYKHLNHVHNSSDSRRNSSFNPSHTHQHYCERCYDYGPIRCHSTVVIALFAYAVVSHDNSTVTSK